MRRYVIDANVLLDYIDGRAAAKRVIHLLREAHNNRRPVLMSAVNWGEVIATVWRMRGEQEARRLPDLLPGETIEFRAVGPAEAFAAARLKAVHKLPYADCFAAELAMRESATLVTADPHFERLGKQVPILWLR